jgi:hypothetical protein
VGTSRSWLTRSHPQPGPDAGVLGIAFVVLLALLMIDLRSDDDSGRIGPQDGAIVTHVRR